MQKQKNASVPDERMGRAKALPKIGKKMCVLPFCRGICNVNQREAGGAEVRKKCPGRL